jgi:hypothetical protein
VPSEWESEPLRRAWAEQLVGANPLPLLFALIHPSAWKVNSANYFACRAFSEFAPALVTLHTGHVDQLEAGPRRVPPSLEEVVESYVRCSAAIRGRH